VQVMREDELVHVVVEDDGIGIHGRTNSRSQSFGLAGMKERIAVLGGVSRVISAKGKGTRIEITVPAGEPAPSAEHTPARAAAHAASRPN
jgi:signal transduction histidine kinase